MPEEDRMDSPDPLNLLRRLTLEETQLVYAYFYVYPDDAPEAEVARHHVEQLGSEFFIWWADGDVLGPYATLVDAVCDGGLHVFNERVREITSPVLSDEVLRSLLVYRGAQPHTFLVNGRPWLAEPGKPAAPILPGK